MFYYFALGRGAFIVYSPRCSAFKTELLTPERSILVETSSFPVIDIPTFASRWSRFGNGYMLDSTALRRKKIDFVQVIMLILSIVFNLALRTLHSRIATLLIQVNRHCSESLARTVSPSNHPIMSIHDHQPNYFPWVVSAFVSTSLSQGCAWNSSFKLSTTSKSACVLFSIKHKQQRFETGFTLTIVPIILYQLLESARLLQHLCRRALVRLTIIVLIMLVRSVASCG